MPTLDNLVVLAAVFGVALDDIVVIDADGKAQISAWINNRAIRKKYFENLKKALLAAVGDKVAVLFKGHLVLYHITNKSKTILNITGNK